MEKKSPWADVYSGVPKAQYLDQFCSPYTLMTWKLALNAKFQSLLMTQNLVTHVKQKEDCNIM